MEHDTPVVKHLLAKVDELEGRLREVEGLRNREVAQLHGFVMGLERRLRDLEGRHQQLRQGDIF